MKTILKKEVRDLIIREPTEAPELEKVELWLGVHAPFTAENLEKVNWLNAYAPFNAPSIKEIMNRLHMNTQFELLP